MRKKSHPCSFLFNCLHTGDWGMSSFVWRRWGLLESYLGAQGSVALSSTAFLQRHT